MKFSLDKEKQLPVIIAIGLILRMMLFAGIALQGNADLLYEGDTGNYQALGHAIAKGDFLFSEGHVRQMAYIRTPGYPLFMGIFYALGLDDFAIGFFQVLLDSLAIYLMFRLGEQLGKVGWQAALLYAISPIFISFSFKLITEGFFIFVFLLINLLYFKSMEKKDEKKLVLVGLLFGFLILIRPIALAFPIFYAALYYWQRRELKGIAYMIIPAYAIAGLWVLRNIVVTGELSFSRIGTISYACWTGSLLANDESVDISPWQKEYERFGFRHPDDCVERIFDNPQPAASTVTQIMLAYPLVYLQHMLNAALLLFSPQTPNYIIDILGQERPHLSLILFERGLDIPYILSEVSKNSVYLVLLIVFAVYQLILYALVLLGILRSEKYGKMLLILAILMIAYIIILQGPQLLFSGYRYRMPAEPLLIMLAAFGLKNIGKKGEKKNE